MTPTMSRLVRLAPAIALVAIAAWSAVRTVDAGAGVPDDRAWAAVAARVRPQLGPDDLIVFAPRWIDPVGRLHLGDRISVAQAARLDAARFPTVWELSIRGARAPETRGLALTQEFAIGGVTARRFAQAPALVATDFVAALPGAAVTGERARGPAAVVAEVGFTPRRCIQVVPQPDREVSVTFADVALGRELAVGAGLADVFTRRDVRDPGELTVTVDGVELARWRFGVDDGWTVRTLATRPGRGTVRFTARAVGLRAANRLVCFAAEARR